MNFEPQKFFIGLVDFFSIILPGALLTYLVKDSVGPYILGASYGSLKGGEDIAIFLISSYLLGHFIFLLGSRLLDDLVYEPVRKATHAEQIKRLAKGKALSPAFLRWSASLLFKKEIDLVVAHVIRLKEYYLEPGDASSTINPFQWCKARLGLEHPQALDHVQRFEADSKFFRSLVIVLFVLIPYGLIINRTVISFIGLPMLILAFLRYIDQRIKSLNQAYWYIITLEASREGGYPKQSETRKDGMTHTGGVVFRRSGDRLEYLLVQAKNDPEEWVLPKGQIEPGERKRETAVREVREETGAWARVRDKLNSISITVKEKPADIQFYLMEAMEEGEPDEKRQPTWLSIDEAIERATRKETKDLLKSVKKIEPEIRKYKKIASRRRAINYKSKQGKEKSA